jgi:two-component system, cell cycle sensor histidine kinase and response regulator CckA
MFSLDLILNLSLLVSLSIISGFIENRWSRDTRRGQILQGLLFGAAAIIGMLRPLVFSPGLIFDGRSIMTSLCALFFGPWAATAACIMALACRIYMGGSGMVTGLLVIVSSTAIGLLAHYRFQPDIKPPSTARLYHFGIIVHVVMIALMLTLPAGTGWQVIKKLGPAVLLLYPLATILAGKILADQVSKNRDIADLQASEELFKTLFERHLAVKLIIDPETGEIVDVNQAAADYYGWSREQLKGMNIQDINTLSPEAIRQEIAKANTGTKVHFEFRHCRADGSVRDVAIFTSKITIKGKNLLHSIIHDITEQKQTAQKLTEKETQYRELFDNAPIGIFATTSKGQARSVNTAMAHMLGFATPREAILHYTDLAAQIYVIPDQRHQFLRLLQEKGQVNNFEYQAKTSSGKIIWVSMNARFAGINDDGSFTIEGFATDITSRRTLEDQFAQAQKMESVGRLAGGVAHDYNNMLTVIHGYTELALLKVDPDLPLHHDLQEILKATDRSIRITGQLLAFARKQVVTPKPLDLNTAIEGMLKMLRHLIGEDITLSWTPGATIWPVMIDPSQIDQILANLCVNARDAIINTGMISLETKTCSFDAAYCNDHSEFSPGDYVQLAFSDDGHGMDKETVDKIFEPFFTTKELGRGTGLGLATVYGIIKQNKGIINVYSEPGTGTSFHIYLPRHKTPETVSRPQEKENTEKILSVGSENILLVEDEVPILKLATIILESLGYKVMTAETSDEALHLAEKHVGKIDLLITDVIMPELNGKELAKRVQTLYPEIHCLFMSGFTANIIAERGILDEDIHFIQKPFSREELATHVRQALNHQET